MEIQASNGGCPCLAAAICWVPWKSHALYCTVLYCTTRSHNDCVHKGDCISYPISHASCISVNTEAHKSCSTSTTHSSYPSFSASHVLGSAVMIFRKKWFDQVIRSRKKKGSGTRSPAVCPSPFVARGVVLGPTMGRFPVLGSCLSQQQIHLGLGDSQSPNPLASPCCCLQQFAVPTKFLRTSACERTVSTAAVDSDFSFLGAAQVRFAYSTWTGRRRTVEWHHERWLVDTPSVQHNLQF
jgi:hypothetical protein